MEDIQTYSDYKTWDDYVTLFMRKAQRSSSQQVVTVESNRIDGRILAVWTGREGYVSESRPKSRLWKMLLKEDYKDEDYCTRGAI